MAKDTNNGPGGMVCIPKDEFNGDLWLAEPFSRGQAWLDLWSRANDRRRMVNFRGVMVTLERGQIGHSQQTLAERWRWGRAKVRAFLTQLQEEFRCVTVKETNVTTIITILDYAVYNPDTTPELPLEPTPEHGDETADRAANRAAEQTTEGATEHTADRAANRAQKIEERSKKGEEGRGEGAAPRPSVIASDEEIRTFCASWPGDLSRGIPGGIPEGWWLGWVANRLQAERWPTEWQRALVLSFTADFVRRHPKAVGETGLLQKNAAPVSGAVSASVLAIEAQNRVKALKAQVNELEEEMHQDRVGNLPRDPDKAARLRSLRGQLAQAEKPGD